MKLGVTLPQFRTGAHPSLRAAGCAEELGFDGVFVFDHLWAIGKPGSPAVAAFPLLGALSTTVSAIAVGTLVARIGLVPDAVLVNQFRTVHDIVGDRLIAGVGTGDRLSAAENVAYGIAYPSSVERRRRLGQVCEALRGHGITTWVGGVAEPTRRVAVAHADALNLWEVDAGVVAAERRLPVTWGGALGTGAAEMASGLAALRAAGATWAVCAPAYGDADDPRPALRALAAAAGLT